MQDKPSALKPELISRRLYEIPLKSGKRSYRCDLEINGRQVRKTLKARNRTEARKEQAALIAQHARGELGRSVEAHGRGRRLRVLDLVRAQRRIGRAVS